MLGIINTAIPVGLVKNINAKFKPDKKLQTLIFFLLIYHLVREKIYNIVKDVSDKSIR